MSFWRGIPSDWADTRETENSRARMETKKIRPLFLDMGLPSFQRLSRFWVHFDKKYRVGWKKATIFWGIPGSVVLNRIYFEPRLF